MRQQAPLSERGQKSGGVQTTHGGTRANMVTDERLQTALLSLDELPAELGQRRGWWWWRLHLEVGTFCKPIA